MIEVVCGAGLARASSKRSGSLKPMAHQRHFAVAQDPTPSPGLSRKTRREGTIRSGRSRRIRSASPGSMI
eukprot:5919704-Lingulodinium_polyedra.AAC.1